ncbi:B12-binding domain-containing radical SAM protein [Chloroflexota bacterium]
MARPFLLINTNMVQPPVSPVGLEYVGQALLDAGFPVQVIDLAFADDWREALKAQLAGVEPLAVGISVRNTDDCCFATRQSFLLQTKEIVSEVKRLTGAFTVLGGVAYSVMPEIVLHYAGAEAGIAGEGETALPLLAKALSAKGDISQIPNLVYRYDDRIISNPKVNVDLRCFPASRRRLFDNLKYEQLGAMVGVETKRGCSQPCIFCADPVAKGKEIRLRPPEMVVSELKDLVDQGVSWIYFCDAEFNLPPSHAEKICKALIASGLSEKIRWYCYCAPTPFNSELAQLMKRAGCHGINFGVDSLDDGQLRRLGRAHSFYDISELVQVLRKAGINYMFDFLFGGPGETDSSIASSISRVKDLEIPLAGIAAGVRVYPGTPLARGIEAGNIQGKLFPAGEETFRQPLFYLSPLLSRDIMALVNHHVAGDPRFLVLAAPDEEGSYNYADDTTLARLIRQGARGAYWDILQKNSSSR